MDFCYKIFNQDGDRLLAIADSSIIGKTFEEGNLQIMISKDFYSDKRCNEENVIDIMKGATIINAVGKDIIGIMVKENIVDNSMILIIDGVPHAQIVYMK